MKKFLLEASIICILAIAMALLTNGLRSNGLPLSAAQTPVETTTMDEGVRRISIEAAVVKFDQKAALFADARPAADFAAGHIAGAVSLPVSASDQWMGRFLATTDPEQTVITYCAGPRCELGMQLARILSEAGFERVFYVVDGWGQWNARSMPTEKGGMKDNA